MAMNHGQHVVGEMSIGVVAAFVDQSVGTVMADQDGNTTRLIIDLGVPVQTAPIQGALTVGVDQLVSGPARALSAGALAAARRAVDETLAALLARLAAPQNRLGRLRDVRDHFLADIDSHVAVDGLTPEQAAAVRKAARSALRTYTHQIIRALGEP